MKHYDVVIVGGGIIGVTLALAISAKSKVLLIEAHPALTENSPAGDRAIVLSAASQTILHTLGLWNAIAPFATPVNNVHVSDRGHFGAVRLSAEKEGVSALGYVVQAKYLDSQLNVALQQNSQITLCYEAEFTSLKYQHNEVQFTYQQHDQLHTVQSQLVVAADGQNSALRSAVGIDVVTTTYHQHAIISVIDLARHHGGTAYERFTAEGPLALLPLAQQQAALVWTVPAEKSAAILAKSPAEFLRAVQENFGYRLGQFTAASTPAAFPIVMKQAREIIKPSTIIMGNAANAIHPIAGQGLNLGLRDVAVLADLLQSMPNAATDTLLQEYAQRRHADHRDIVAITHNLVGIFSNAFLPLIMVRNVGLVAMELLSPLKKWLSKRTMGFAGYTTPLVCGVKVE